MKFALVTTTINVPHNLEAYAKDIAEFGPKDTAIVIAGDKKTPKGVLDFCKSLTEKYGVFCIYISPEDQDRLFPAYSKWLPWNCIQRRNMAILYAYHNGAEVIATVDDDNFWEGKGYFEGHGKLGVEELFYATTSKSGWFNVCGKLGSRKVFYHRGYPVNERGKGGEPAISYQKSGKIMVNAGLWLGDPDVDAVTRLSINPTSDYIKDEEGFEGNIVLNLRTKSPFNSQNTALHRDVIPAYCMLPFTGRYDDIIPSYFVKRIADHLGDYVRFGSPIVRQARNNHDLWKDLEDERIGMQLTDRIVDWIYEIPLFGKTYGGCIKELTAAFAIKARDANLPEEQDVFLHNIVAGYREWSKYT